MVAKFRKNKKAFRRDVFLPALLGITILLLIGFLANANLKLSKKRAEVETEASTLETEMSVLEEERDFLKAQISLSGGEDYLEEIARNIRNMMREGEKAVAVVPLPDESGTEGEEENTGFLQNIFNWIR